MRGVAKHLFTALSAAGLALARLPQKVTNGASAMGTLGAPRLPGFLNGPLPRGTSFPWGNRHCHDTNPYYLPNVPNTGITRSFYWEVTNTTLSPDGVALPMLVVNGEFPGPLIEANWGDWIEVTIKNSLVTEGTTIHWHGFLQTGTPWYDGTATMAQCPIAPGKTFTSRFRAELYGTTWWHGHYTSQYVNGLLGPMVIHGPTTAPYDIDVGPVLLSDWFHNYYINLLEQIFHATPAGPILPPMSNNMLIQGKNNYNCSWTTLPCTPNAGTAQFKFQSGKKHLLRLINHSAEALLFFSIDGYNMTVIANDFVPLTPYTTDLITLGVGQRTDIIVQGSSSSTDSVWMRITEGPSGLGPPGTTGCSLNDGNSYSAAAAIYYENANTNVLPTTTSIIDPSRYLFPAACNNNPLDTTVPAFAMPIKAPDTTLNLLLTGNYNSTGDFVWYINNVTFYGDLNDPTLLEAILGNTNFPPEKQVYNMGTNSTVRIVFTSVGFPASHPMHIHGHNMYVLAEGVGSWDGSTVVNPSNPQRRDVQLIQPNGYLVVQLDLDNPGVWPFHCHVAWHVSEGMNFNILESPAKVAQMKVPYSIAQTCRDWSAWTGNHVVDQIDAGL